MLKIFWEIHDPTTPNRQGPDMGTQYGSAIFFRGREQESATRASKTALENARKFRRPIVTEILPAPEFYRAEDYHQQYFEKRGIKSCQI